MKKLKTLSTITIILVIIIGGIPGIEFCFNDLKDSTGQYYKTLITGVPSIVVGILIGFFLSRYLLKIWLSTNKSVGLISLLVSITTLITGVISVLVAWEITWVLPRLFGWRYTGEFNPWANLLDHYLIMLVYACIPVGIISVVNGLFSYIYLKVSKN